MEQKFCLDEKSWKEAQAALLLAKRLGLIEDAGMEALERRRQQKNEKNRQAEEAGEMFYGPRFYSAPMYLQYELTRFRLCSRQSRFENLASVRRFLTRKRETFMRRIRICSGDTTEIFSALKRFHRS